MRLSVRVLTAAVAGCALAPSAGSAGSLPRVPGGSRPGPAILYARPPVAPQLQNTGVWRAAPILVSGAESYRSGEFVYQDYLFDDHGGYGTQDPGDPFSEVEQLFSPKHGTLTYPTDTARYANNAADLVEFRVKPLSGATAFRVTMNTMIAPSALAFTVALGDASVERDWPFGAGVRSPASLFLTVHGSTGILTRAADGKVLRPAPIVTVDRRRAQITVRVPHAAWNPGRRTVRMAMGTGLWDGAARRYLQPAAAATATAPGGASPSGEALFNMAFRLDEPQPEIYNPGTSNTIVEGSQGVKADGSWWRERRQGDVLASGDVSVFAAEVSFAKLRRSVRDDSMVTSTGGFDRIFASRYTLGKGVDYTVKCLTSLGRECTGRYLGQLQPYAIYVPAKPVPPQGFGLVVSMHGLSANFNEFLGSHEEEELGERGAGSVFISPEGRGPDGGWKSYAEADTFEMWADAARHYRLNPAITDVTGYSMGGQGTYELASRWPDLWSRAFPIVGPPTSAASFKSLRNIPTMAWYGHNDELVGPQDSEQAFQNASAAGIRYDLWEFAPAGHITEGNNDEFGPAATFFGAATVDRDPVHVTYTWDPSTDTRTTSPTNHAYWLYGMQLAAGATTAFVDARTLARGVGDPPAQPLQVSAGTLNGGSHGPLPYTRRNLTWGPAPRSTRADVIGMSATGLSAVTVDARRAGITCAAKVRVTSATPVKVRLADCPV